MAMTPKVAVAALLVASLTAGCGASAEEKETACWTKRQAIIAEMQVWTAMDDATVLKTLGLDPWVNPSFPRSKKIARLEASMPYC